MDGRALSSMRGVDAAPVRARDALDDGVRRSLRDEADVRRAPARVSDTETTDGEDSSSSSSSSSSLSSSSEDDDAEETRRRNASEMKAKTSVRKRRGGARDEYDVEGALPRREHRRDKDEDASFFTRCYHDGAKFCGLGILLDDYVSESSTSSESESSSSSDSESESASKADAGKKLGRVDSVELVSSDDDKKPTFDASTVAALEEEKQADLWPSPTLIEREFNDMRRRLQRKALRAERDEEKMVEGYESLVGKRRKGKSVTWRIYVLVKSWPFDAFISLCILYSAIVSGTVAAAPDKYSSSNFESMSYNILNACFSVEVVLKIMSSGITAKRGGVEQLAVFKPHYYFKDYVNCFDFVVTFTSLLEYVMDGGKSLGALRNLRLIRLLRLLRLVRNMRIILEGVVKGIMSIVWILILLSVVVYIYAVFGVILFKANDPRHFGTLGTAMSTVISVCTMSDWLGFLYVNYYGCDEYGYTSDTDAAYCTTPTAKKWATTLYMVSLTLILGNIMMSLFIGVITNKMEEAAFEVKQTKEKNQAQIDAAIANDLWSDVSMIQAKLGQNKYDQLMYHLNLLSGVRREGKARPVPHIPMWRRGQIFLQHIVSNPIFEYVVVLVIIAAGALSGISADQTDEESWFATVEDVFLGIFAFELGVKFIAALDKRLSFYTGVDKWWNIFDTFVVMFGLIPNSLSAVATAVRLFRLLRVLRLVRIIKPLQVVVISLVAGLQAIVYVALLMCLIFFIYAVAGVTLFAENDPFHFESLFPASITLFTVTFLEAWMPVYSINYNGCDVNPYGDVDDGIYYASIIGSSYDGTEGTTNPCSSPDAKPFYTFFFFSTFILVSAMVLVSALVGIIVTSMQNAQAVVQQALEENRRADETSEYFKFKEASVDATVKVFEILDAGFTGALTPEVLLEKMHVLDIPTNDAFVHRAFAIANKMTDKPFDRADFLLLVGLAERAVMLQEQFGDDIVNQDDESASEGHMDRSQSRFSSRSLVAFAKSKLKERAP